MLSHWGFFSIEQLFWYQCHCGRASMLNDQCYCRRIIRLLLIIQALNCTHNGYFQKYIFFKQLEKSFGSIILELDYKNHCFVVNLFLLTIPIIVLLSIFFFVRCISVSYRSDTVTPLSWVTGRVGTPSS